MRRALVLLAVLAACKTSEKKAGTPSGPAVAARCDYVSKTAGENHSCFEVYADAQVDALDKWCATLQGPRDRGTFTKGEACPAEGRHGGCLYPNGSVRWKYKGDVSCIGALEFKDSPPRKESTPYRCMGGPLCRETQSVFDLSKTVEATNCKTGGGTYSAGSCSTENVVGRCEVRRYSDDTTWVYYAPAKVELARSQCTELEGTFVEAAAGSGSGSAGAEGSDSSSGGAGSSGAPHDGAAAGSAK
ncbi:MAG: hypothetical protein HOV81_13015 [Kofleriaceae bacterium]|nr:hypothetical protein [Kofleriaceae bacterium]